MTHTTLAGQPRPVVACRRLRPSLAQRLRTLADRTEAFTIALEADATDAPVAQDPAADVVVIGVRDDDRDATDVLRSTRRSAPDARCVVAGSGTVWFDAAFSLGVDAWVDERADDATLLAAIVGGRSGATRDRSAGSRWAVRPYLPRLRRRTVDGRTGGASCGSW